MSKVIAYKNTDRHCFCQIKFNSRERVLVSVASVPGYSIKVIKLLFGIFPYRTIWEYTARATAEKKAQKELISLCLGQAKHKVDHPLDAIMLRLVACRSCDEAVRTLRLAEQEASGQAG